MSKIFSNQKTSVILASLLLLNACASPSLSQPECKNSQPSSYLEDSTYLGVLSQFGFTPWPTSTEWDSVRIIIAPAFHAALALEILNNKTQQNDIQSIVRVKLRPIDDKLIFSADNKTEKTYSLISNMIIQENVKFFEAEPYFWIDLRQDSIFMKEISAFSLKPQPENLCLDGIVYWIETILNGQKYYVRRHSCDADFQDGLDLARPIFNIAKQEMPWLEEILDSFQRGEFVSRDKSILMTPEDFLE